VIVQLMTDLAGENCWLWKVKFEFRAMNVPGETLYAWGKVSALEDAGSYGLVTLETGLVNQHGIESTPGTAIVVLARRGGPAVPYPFNPAVVNAVT
jgi:acyl dehydratase